jgi:nondiscriminating glutamyl-tRNA synthetase
MSHNTSENIPKVRVRFAPSPTGYLHVGGARTALYNYLFARNQGGEFILRIEDTDAARNTEESLRMVMSDLVWLGLKWDEGPHPFTQTEMGSYGPYKQSQRLDIYLDVAQELLKSGKAYYCFMTEAEIEAQRQEFIAAGKNPHINSPYENWDLEKSQAELKTGKTAVVRFKTKHLKKDYLLKDLVRGEVTFPSDMVGDFVLLRSDGMPVYNFCCVVDDHLMKITHVLRAEEHLSNTLRQLMIFEAMKWQIPLFGHISLVLDEDRQKMSKRRGATSCHQFREEGYLPEALLNFVVLLGWSHPDQKELFSIEDMIRLFSADRLHPSGAIFDRVKLRWMNSQYLRALSNEDLWIKTEPFLKKAELNLPFHDKNWAHSSIGVFKSYMETLIDAVPFYTALDDSKFEIKADAAEVLAWEPTRAVLTKWTELLKAHQDEKLTEAQFLKIQEGVKTTTGAKGKNLFQPVRVAVIGQPHGTELKILVPLMTRSSLITRAEKVLASLK